MVVVRFEATEEGKRGGGGGKEVECQLDREVSGRAF